MFNPFLSLSGGGNVPTCLLNKYKKLTYKKIKHFPTHVVQSYRYFRAGLCSILSLIC